MPSCGSRWNGSRADRGAGRVPGRGVLQPAGGAGWSAPPRNVRVDRRGPQQDDLPAYTARAVRAPRVAVSCPEPFTVTVVLFWTLQYVPAGREVW